MEHPVPSLSLPGDRPERAEVLRGLRDFLEREKALTYKLHRDGAPGDTVSKRLARLVDSAVVSAHRFAQETAGEQKLHVVWIATGGYGRGELQPFSDIDLMLFHTGALPPGETPPAREQGHPHVEYLMSTVLQLLWDAGLSVSHACRDTQSCLQVMGKDYVASSALLESRYVVGDEPLFRRFEEEVILRFFSANLFSFIADRTDETRDRHRSRGMSPFTLEPNVKEDPGGLRDAQMVFWMQRLTRLLPYKFGGMPPLLKEEEELSLQKAYHRIQRIRTELHLLSGRKNDVLERALQQEVARALGYRETNGSPGAATMMREYFTAAGKTRFHLNTTLARLTAAIGPPAAHRRAIRRPVDADTVAIGKKLYFTGEDVADGPKKAKKLMDVFLTAQRHHLEPSQEVLKLVHEHLWQVDEGFRNNPDVARSFMGILEGSGGNVHKVLSHMRDCGLLGRYIPEFDDLIGFVHYESLHTHTVDEHSLRAIGEIDSLEQLGSAGSTESIQKRKLLDETGKPAVLRLALLLHDIGKPRGPHHSLLGATLIPAVAQRLCLEEDDARLLEFLVENHLEMTYLFERRDHGEEAALATFAEKVGSLTNLKFLYLLTYADIRSSGSWFAWYDSLLWELYQKTEIMLSEDTPPVAKSTRAFREEFLELARAKGLEEQASGHCEAVPSRYILEVSPEEAMVHLGLIHGLEEDNCPIAMAFAPAENYIDVWLSTEDRPARFSQIAGVFAARGLNIISAQAYTRRDGIILDRFRVAAAQHEQQQFNEKLCRELRQDFLGVFSGKMSLAEMLRSRQRRVVPGKRPFNNKSIPRIYVDNKSSPEYTIVDVVVTDRVGLLYNISLCLADCGLDIHFAKISTKLDQAIDVFYVVDVVDVVNVNKKRRTKVLEEDRIKEIKRALSKACVDKDLYEPKNKSDISG